jgi:hypothetical protein
MHISLGITSSSGVLAVSGLTLPPGDYIISVGAFGYEIKEYPYIVTSEAPINDQLEIEIVKGFTLPTD